MIRTFTDFKDFEDAARAAGVDVDLRALLSLDTVFVEAYRNYLILNLKDYDREPNNLLVVSDDQNLMFSDKKITERDLGLFRITLQKKYGESTVLVLLAIRDVLDNYSKRFEAVRAEIGLLDRTLNVEQIIDASHGLRKLTDRVEDLQDLMVKLEDRKINEFRTGYVEYDFEILLSKVRLLLDRVKRAQGDLTGLRNEAEFKATRELNKRIEHLSQVMKRLTAITVLVLIPTFVVGFFGQNFEIIPFENDGLFWAAMAGMVFFTGVTAFFLRAKDYF